MKLNLPGTLIERPGAVRRDQLPSWRRDWSPSLVALVYALGFLVLLGALVGSMTLLVAAFGGAGAAVGVGAWLFGCIWFMGRALIISERRNHARRTRPLAGHRREEES